MRKDNDPRDYVGYDLGGFPYNSKYPPDKARYGEDFEGYPTKGRGVLFYDFAVMYYDAWIVYKGKKYYFLNEGKAYLSDSHFSEEIQAFNDPMDLIENLLIEGRPLIEIIDELDDAEPV